MATTGNRFKKSVGDIENITSRGILNTEQNAVTNIKENTEKTIRETIKQNIQDNTIYSIKDSIEDNTKENIRDNTKKIIKNNTEKNLEDKSKNDAKANSTLNSVLDKISSKKKAGSNHTIYLSSEVSEALAKVIKQKKMSKSELIDSILKEVFGL